MALDPSATYPGQIDTTDPTGYPFGKAQNVTVAGDGTGTPLEKTIVNDILGFEQALLVAAGIAPSGTPDAADASQYLDALKALFAPDVQTFASSDTWTKPTNAKHIEIVAIGGGGGGGGTLDAGTPRGGGGGGASGQVVRASLPASMVGNTLGITIGSAGAGVDGGAGTAGTATTVASGATTILTALGGGGGVVGGSGSASAHGDGGSRSATDSVEGEGGTDSAEDGKRIIPGGSYGAGGGAGSDGNGGGASDGGDGGTGWMGSGGAGGLGSASDVTKAGGAGIGYGSGGGGGAFIGGTTANNGGGGGGGGGIGNAVFASAGQVSATGTSAGGGGEPGCVIITTWRAP